jgi:transcriptional regulator with XRE-family HTH domain
MFCATRPYTDSAMPRKSPASERPISDSETMGQRLARLRKERSWTQVELAERTGIVQTVLSDYERGKLRLNADMIVRFAQALDVTTDELLQPKAEPSALRRKPSLRVLRRLERIEKLPAHQQNTLLKTIDGFLKGVAS